MQTASFPKRPVDEPNVKAVTPSPSKVATGHIISPIKKGIDLTEEVETPKERLQPHIALDTKSIASGYDRIRIVKDQIITDPYVISVLLKAKAPIAPANGKWACCPQCNHVFGL